MNNHNDIDREIYQLLTEQPTRELKYVQQSQNPTPNSLAGAAIWGVMTGIAAIHSAFWIIKALFMKDFVAVIAHLALLCITGLFSLGCLAQFMDNEQGETPCKK